MYLSQSIHNDEKDDDGDEIEYGFRRLHHEDELGIKLEADLLLLLYSTSFYIIGFGPFSSFLYYFTSVLRCASAALSLFKHFSPLAIFMKGGTASLTT